MIKTTQSRLSELTAAVQSMHSYDVCEVIAVPVAGGSATYLQWVEDTVKEQPPKKTCCGSK
jgi:periplasmic divalent cation tolerance protein